MWVHGQRILAWLRVSSVNRAPRTDTRPRYKTCIKGKKSLHNIQHFDGDKIVTLGWMLLQQHALLPRSADCSFEIQTVLISIIGVSELTPCSSVNLCHFCLHPTSRWHAVIITITHLKRTKPQFTHSLALYLHIDVSHTYLKPHKGFKYCSIWYNKNPLQFKPVRYNQRTVQIRKQSYIGLNELALPV